MTKDLKIVIFASEVSFLIPHSLITLTMFLIQSQKFKSSCTPKIYMVSLVRSTIFIPQSAKLTFFSMSIPAISHLLTLGRSPENLKKLSITPNTVFTDNIAYTDYHKKSCVINICYIEIFMLKYFYTMNIFVEFGKYEQNF